MPRGPKGTCLAAGSHGGARAGSGCAAPWRVPMHGRARAHVWRLGPLCKISKFAPGASQSFGASIGPLGTQRVDLGRRWPKTFHNSSQPTGGQVGAGGNPTTPAKLTPFRQSLSFDRRSLISGRSSWRVMSMGLGRVWLARLVILTHDPCRLYTYDHRAQSGRCTCTLVHRFCLGDALELQNSTSLAVLTCRRSREEWRFAVYFGTTSL